MPGAYLKERPLMQFKEKKILLVSPDFPYPPNHGGRVDIWGRIKVLHEMGFSIDLLATVKEQPLPRDIEIVNQYVDKLILCKRSSGIHLLLMPKPYQLATRIPLSHIILPQEYDFALLETEYVAPVLNNNTLRANCLILREHNDEAAYSGALARSTSSVLKKIFYAFDSVKFKMISSRLKKRIRNIMFISHDEYDRFIARTCSSGVAYNPIFLPPPLGKLKLTILPLVTKNVLFVGSLFMPNNVSAVKWYLEHVHQRLLDIPEYKFIIAGNTKGADPFFINYIKYLCETHNEIIFYENPDDIGHIYNQCSVFVNPMHHGAGVKLKTINAIESGLAVISTSVGKEGTGFKDLVHLRVADSAEDFVGAVRDLISHPDEGRALVSAAQQYLNENFDHRAILDTFLKNCISGKL